MATSVTLTALRLPFSTLVRRTMCGRGLLAILLQRCRQSLPVTARKACVTCMLGRWPYVAGLGQLCSTMCVNCATSYACDSTCQVLRARGKPGPSWTTAVAASNVTPSPPQFRLPSNDLLPFRHSSSRL